MTSSDLSAPEEPAGAEQLPETNRQGIAQRFTRRLGAAFRPRLIRLGVSAAGGGLLCMSFPPFGWWWAAVPAAGLLSWVLIQDRTTLAGGFGYGFLFGLGFFVPLLPWISGLVGVIPWLALAALEALFPAVFGLLAVLVRRLPGWPLWFALEWSLQEWLRCNVPFGGFPWGQVALGQTGGPFLLLVQLGGVPLLSFAITLLGTSMCALVLEIVRWWPEGAADSERPHTRVPAVILPGVCICIVLLTTAMTTPQVRRSSAGSVDEPTVTVAAVQGNVPRLGLDFNSQRRAVLDNHVRETVQLAADVRAGTATRPLFVVWPENSSDIDPIHNADAAAQIEFAAEAIGVPILVGAVITRPESTRENPAASNTVVVWEPGRGPRERHDKQIIQPFGEYLPWRGFFKHLSSYADRAGYFVPGSGTGVVHANGVSIGVATCWEVIFDRALRESVRNGAEVLAVPSNNATFDRNMSEQQLAFAKARAVEHDRYVVVAGTVGISAIIAPDGKEISRTAFFTPGYLDAPIRLKSDQTLATRWGPAIQLVLVSASVSIILAAILHNRLFMRLARLVSARSGRTAKEIHERSQKPGI
jgi:apolipoprotein N-acyltransferase